MNDDELRAVAHEHRSSVERRVDTGVELAALHRRLTSGGTAAGRDAVDDRVRSPRPRAWPFVAVLATAAAVVIAVVVVGSSRRHTVDTITPPTDAGLDGTSPPSVAAPTTSAADAPAVVPTPPPTSAVPTTTAPPASAEASAPDVLAVERNCIDESRCTQLAVTGQGFVAYDPTTETLTVLDRGGQTVVDEMQLTAPLSSPSTGAWIVAVGPQDVVYLAAVPPGAADPLVDLYAVPTSGPGAGVPILVASGLDGSGDSDLVPTPAGLAVVGCCGADTVRPAPDATVYGWVGSDGSAVTSETVHFEIDRGERWTLHRIDPGPDATDASWELPAVAVGSRGMPELVSTDDGGALLLVSDPLTWDRYLVRLAPDAEGLPRATSMFLIDPDAMGSGPAVLEPGGTVVVVDAEGRFVRRALADAGVQGWRGSVEVDTSGQVWTATAVGIDAEIDARRPAWARNPLLLARQLVPWARGAAQSPMVEWDAATGMLTVTEAGLVDYSFDAVRYTFTLSLGADGLYRVGGGWYAIRCQPDSGHQDFQSLPCR